MSPADRSDSFAGLPAILREIAEVAGLSAAMALAEQHGGFEMLIPHKVDADHWLTRCVGAAAAAMICDHYCVRDADGHAVGAFRLYLPQAGTGLIAKAHRQLVRDLASGQFTPRAAARRCGLTERSAKRMRRRLKLSQDDQDKLL